MDWDGGNLVYEYDFEEQGVPSDDLQILGRTLLGLLNLDAK